jgi:hypothetical protein
VAQHALEVDVGALPRREDPRRGGVAGKADEPQHEHARARHVGRVAQPAERLHHDQHGHDQQQHAVRERAQHLAALQPVGAGGCRRDPREAGRDQPDCDRPHVGDEVPGVREQGERVGEQAADHGRHEERCIDGQRHRHAAPVAGAADVEPVRMMMPVTLSDAANRTGAGSDF